MAFAVPNHLPRHGFSGKDQSQGSTKKHYDSVIAKVAAASFDDLKSSNASSWVAEVTKDIDQTKTTIHERIHTSLPDFERQFQSSRDIVQRVYQLQTETDGLTTSIYNQSTGLVPSISRRLGEHSILTQRAKDAEVLAKATEHAVKCRDTLQKLSLIVSEARLAEVAAVSLELERLIQTAPDPLPRAQIFAEIQHRSRVLRDNAQERLGHAYAAAVVLTSFPGEDKLVVSDEVTVPASSQQISLRNTLSALDEQSSRRLIASLRKSLLITFIEPVIWSTASTHVEGDTLILRRTSSGEDPVHSLATVVSYIQQRILLHLPSTLAPPFTKELYTSLQTSLLARLKQDVPSSLSTLPAYITFVNAAIAFEADLTKDLPPSSRQIAEWASSLPSYYEKKRREEILQNVRLILLDESRLGGVRVDKPLSLTIPSPELSSTNGVHPGTSVSPQPVASPPPPVVSSAPALAALPATANDAADEDDGWGFDDEADGDEPPPSEPALLEPPLTNGHTNGNGHHEDPEPGAEVEDDPWAEEDDPWADADTFGTSPSSSTIASPSPSVVKSAKGLEKFSSKSKGSSLASPMSTSASMSSLNGFKNGNGNGLVNRTSSPEPTRSVSPKITSPVPTAPTPPPPRKATPVKETFIVSEGAIVVLKILEDTIEEARQIANSTVFSALPTTHSPPSDRAIGDLLAGTTASILDLFRALTPVAQAEMMELSPSLRMRFSNDCSHLASEVERISKPLSTSYEELITKLKVAAEKLGIVAEQRFDAELEREKAEVNAILSRAQGFYNSGDDEQYAIDESVVHMVVETFLTLAPDWKGVLTPSAYLDAISYLTEEALSGVLRDILTLPDIPEVDSHRLNALCQKLERVKELFVLVPGEESQIGAYVPSWFKFAYMSELLEASLADITYLFESGALIDFEREELVRLVQGLFSDTPLRAKTIEKIRTLGLDSPSVASH